MLEKHTTITPAYTTIEGFKNNIIAQKEIPIDRVSTPVWLCDGDFIITSANRAAHDMFGQHEKDMPVAADALIGSPLTIFYTEWHGQQIVECTPGGLRLSMQVTPLNNERGEFDGAFIDWAVSAELYS